MSVFADFAELIAEKLDALLDSLGYNFVTDSMSLASVNFMQLAPKAVRNNA